MGSAGKLVIALAEELEPVTRQSVEGPFWWWTGLGEGGRTRRCLTSFAGVPELLPALERPLGRVVLAGEHTVGLRWHGTFEGAIRSGRRAASRVLELLGAV